MALLLLLVLSCCMQVYSVPVRTCPATSADPFNQYFIADTVDRTLYYYCIGAVQFGPYTCGTGTSTAVGAHNHVDICTSTQSAGTTPNVVTTPVPTTVAAPTTTTTSGPTTPTASQVLSGMHIKEGAIQFSIRDLATCQSMCASMTTCYGIDWNTVDGSCWFHSSVSICGALVSKPGCTHYRYRDCSTAATTRLPFLGTTIASTAATPSPVFETLTGMHILGGTRKDAFRDVSTCIAECSKDSTCVGADFDTRDLACYFHTITTECTTAIAKPECTHYRLTLSCSTTVAPTPAPAVTKMATCVPLTGMKINGGTTTAFTDSAGCNTGCASTATCYAYSFDTSANICFFHDQAAACPPTLVADANFNFCNFGSCASTGSSSTGMTTLSNMHALGGTAQSQRTLDDCIAGCVASSTCVSIDFDSTLSACYFHTTTTCNAREAKTSCTHVVVKTCA